MSRAILNMLQTCIERGKVDRRTSFPADMIEQDGAAELTRQALDMGIEPQVILNSALIKGMYSVGEKFEKGEVFLPELLISAQAIKAALAILKPFYESGDIRHLGTMVLGTVAGDLHDIGKNIVGMVLEGNGWQVVDLGVDVETAVFAQAAVRYPACSIGMSALLTTTMVNMAASVKELKSRFPKQKIYIGGAPITQAFCDSIGADGYFSNPHSFVQFLSVGRPGD